MRTLGEIIDAVEQDEAAGEEELRYAVHALQKLLLFEASDLYATRDQRRSSNAFGRKQRALKKDPKSWVGWNNDPKNPEYRARARAATEAVGAWFDGDDAPIKEAVAAEVEQRLGNIMKRSKE